MLTCKVGYDNLHSNYVGRCGHVCLGIGSYTVSMALLLCKADACARKIVDILADLLSLFPDTPPYGAEITDCLYAIGLHSSYVGSCGPFFHGIDSYTVYMALLLCEAHACARNVCDTLSDLPAVRREQLSVLHAIAELQLPSAYPRRCPRRMKSASSL